jgi:hypothetical protein
MRVTSSKATGKPVSTFVHATTRFNKIGEALMAGPEGVMKAAFGWARGWHDI